MSSKRDLPSFNCSLARALGVVGDDWSMMILRDAFLGTTRFGDFQRGLGLARNILADRLDRLVRGGVLAREGSPARPEYRLTPKGKALAPALVALMQWGDRWLSDDTPPILMHGPEGRPILPIALQTEAGSVDADDLEARPGPGADDRTRAFLAGRTRHPL